MHIKLINSLLKNIKMKKIENTFSISGYIANDAQIRNFDTASVARFALSVSRPEKNAVGETVYKSALMNFEAWRKNENLDSFDRLKKGEHITVEGYSKPEEWTATDGTKKQRVILVATKFHRTPEVEETPEAPAKKSPKRSKKKAA